MATLWCWIFGHKWNVVNFGWLSTPKFELCRRCGASRRIK